MDGGGFISLEVKVPMDFLVVGCFSFCPGTDGSIITVVTYDLWYSLCYETQVSVLNHVAEFCMGDPISQAKLTNEVFGVRIQQRKEFKIMR